MKRWILRLDPFGRTHLDGLYDMRQGVVFRHAEENMDVVACAADYFGRRIEIVENDGQIGVNPLAKRLQKKRFALFGAEDEVDVQFR